ncbi:MAG: glycoside hydrolase family 13 protein [Pleomorphochaeta sp.]
MENQTWWKESVVYQIYPKSFQDSTGNGIGDIRGIISRLDYLVDLGIDIIWLSPVYESPQDDNGYDISDYKKIYSVFGSMKDFDSLLAECHKRNIKLIMDLVVNHTSDEHPWFIESRKSKDNKYRDYYIWKENKGSIPNNWRSCFSGSAWQYDEKTDSYYLHFFSPKQCDLNWKNKSLREDIYDMMKYWGEKGIDGFRMDVITLIGKESYESIDQIGLDGFSDGIGLTANSNSTHEYLKEMHQEVISKYDWLMVGEAVAANIEDAKKYVSPDRNELNMIFQFEHVDMGCVTPSIKWDRLPLDLVEFKTIFNNWIVGLEKSGWNSLFLNNHDQPRCVSRFGNDSDKYRISSAKMLALILHMMKGTPFIYQGEEIGMTNNYNFSDLSQFRDVETLKAYDDLLKMGYGHDQIMTFFNNISRDNARTPMQWNDSVNAGFCMKDINPWLEVNPNYKFINVESQIYNEDSIYSFYKKLIKLRHEIECIVYGDFKMIDIKNKSIFSYERKLNDTSILVVGNFFDKPLKYNIPKNYLTDKTIELIANMSHKKGELQPYEAFALLNK